MANRKFLPQTLMVCALSVLAAAHAQSAVVAQAGNVSVSASELDDALALQTAESRTKLMGDPTQLASLARTLAARKLLLAQAHAAKFDQTPKIQRELSDARDRLIADAYLNEQNQPPADFPSETEIDAAYQQNKDKLVLPRRYHIAQAVVILPQNSDAATDQAAAAQLQQLRGQSAKGDFITLAKQSAADSAAAAQDGDLGWLREDQLVPAVKSEIDGLSVGDVSQPVKAGQSWHVFKLLDTKPAGLASLAEVHDQLVQALRQQRAQLGAQAYMATLIKQNPIATNEIALAQVAVQARKPGASQ